MRSGTCVPSYVCWCAFGDEEEEEETDEVVDSDAEEPLASGEEEVSIEDTFEAVEEAEAAEL